MQDSSKQALLKHMTGQSFRAVLDAPSGGGWLPEALGDAVAVDGIDLYVDNAPGYRKFWKHDLDEGLPEDCQGYDLICCCEGLEHVGSPLLLLRHFHRALAEGGTLIITTPNVWYPQARLQYLLRGFFPSFPALAGQSKPRHPYAYYPVVIPAALRLFEAGRLPAPRPSFPSPSPDAKHFHERIIGLPAKLYCRSRLKKAKTDEEREYWKQAGTQESLLGRHLIAVTSKETS